MSERPVVVMGLMGSGKTSVAALLAVALGRPLRDSDLDLLAAHGATAAGLAARDGAPALHALEARHLLDALAAGPLPVVAAAASTLDASACREALAKAFAVWLDGPPALLAERMLSGAHRPHFHPDLVKMLTEQRDRRLAAFDLLADLRVDVACHTPEDAATMALAAYRVATRA